ncbi:MAG TPA: SGNH/GDSL hydrolase family protein [Solirubrobacteraceae bacterium]|nr:SGNH/GDSL hydrolase family protein [Solirubrobacteraceae bacterium]
MTTAHRVRGRMLGCLFAAALALAALAFAPAAPAASPPKNHPVKTNYLALGDSLAFGYQAAKVNACASTGCSTPNTLFTTGYVDDFGAFLKTVLARNTTTNLGCPGETTDTLISATNATTGCTTYPFAIHVNHPGTTQLQAALNFLAANPNKVSPITLDIGANDVLAAVHGCTNTTTGVIDLSCVLAAAPGVFAHVAQNVGYVLNRLHTQEPNAEIIVVGLYNPLYPAVYQQTYAQTGDPAAAAAAAAATDALTAQLNSALSATADAGQAYFANPLPTFNPPGNPTVELGTICTLTNVCGPLHDIHPTDQGYQALAGVVQAASSY